MKTASSKLLKWSMIASLAIALMLVSIPFFHGTVLARGGHEAMSFGHEGGRFIGGGERPGSVLYIVQTERHESGFSLVQLLLKVGVLLIGAALFAKGKGFVKWGGGLLAVLALWSLLSFWTVLIAAAIAAAYWLMRRKRPQPQALPSGQAEWLNHYHAANDAHLLDQWEQQIRKEAKE